MGSMKMRIIVVGSAISLLLFTVASWCFFLFMFFIFSEEISKRDDSLDEITNQVDYVSDATNDLLDEREFEKIISQDLSYYLPSNFTSRVKYLGTSPLDLESGQSRVYFVYRSQNYKVDFSYLYTGRRFQINRDSEPELAAF